MGTICASVFAQAVVLARQHPQTTYVPHAWLGVGNGGGRRVRQGGTVPAPPLTSLLHPLAVVPARWHPQTTHLLHARASMGNVASVHGLCKMFGTLN